MMNIFGFLHCFLKQTIIAFLIFALFPAAISAGINQENKYVAYLFAYFEGASGDRKHQEQLRFAVSADFTNWTALNNNQPVLVSENISHTRGIRDPHILRGEDGKTFYMVMTDMSTGRNGWGPNPGIVMLKSDDLINWQHSIIELEKQYPVKFKDVQWVWAPQTIYDPAAGKYLVYFTIRYKNDGKLDFYGAYANADFTGFENEPTLMFSPKHGGIDADIVYKDGMYHLFFKGNTKDEEGNEFESGIKQATAKTLQGTWTEHFDYLDVYHNTRTNVEGSSVFKLNDSDEYILMYDLYSSGRYEFQRSTDLYTFTDKPESFTKDFHPRHGSIIGITAEELNRLNDKWKYTTFRPTGNPIITHKFTADPAALVVGDTLWIFTGEDAAGGQTRYTMPNWCVFSTTDMITFTEYPIPLKGRDFAWSSRQAYAAHVVERNGKFYFYVSTNSTGIGVAVADRPQGPYKDVLGKPLLTRADCFASTHSWACIDPAVFIDDDGQAWLFWGNRECYYVKLKDNMIETDGEIKRVMFDDFVFEEGPWIHKHNGYYYLSYATGFPEKIAYAMSKSIEGPWEYKGILNEVAGNSNTNHQSIVQFKDDWYFIYHNGAIQRDGGSYSRSVCIDRMYYNPDGTIKRIVMTTEGISQTNR